jgi:hypothetical protein
MTFVKTFEQFKEVPLNEAAEPKQITAKGGELARWKVVLRSSDEETISDKNPSDTILRELAEYGGFKTWWKSGPANMPNQKSLAIIYSGVSGKTNLFGKEVAKAEVAFLPYVKQSRNIAYDKGAAAVILYDVTKKEPSAEATVEGSGVKLMAWHEEDLPELRIVSADGNQSYAEALDKEGKQLPFDLVNPPYMYTNGKSASAVNAKVDQPEKPADTQTTAQTTTPSQPVSAVSAASAEMIAVTDKFIGLKMNNAFNQLAKDLQEIIVKNGSGVRPTDANLLKDYDNRVSAATKIRTDGGADGLYGNATATAIGVLIGTNQSVAEITKEIADKLAASFTGITAAEASALLGKVAGPVTPVRGTGTPVKPKQRP